MIGFSCSGVLFDLDGVLVDSIAAAERQWRIWAARHRLDPEHVIHAAHGHRTIETVRLLMPELDAAYEASTVEKGEVEDTAGLTRKECSAELIARLPRDRWAIVTSGTRALATARLRSVGLSAPEKLVTADDVTNGKPNPEPYLKGAALLGLPPSKCLVFEDAQSGIRAAKLAGAKVIAVAGTYPAADLREADAVISSLCEVDLSFGAEGDGSKVVRVSVRAAVRN